MEEFPLLVIIQQSVLTLTPVAVMLIAWSGLSTWKRQLRGTYDFELSRRILLTLYKSRDAVKAARNNFLTPSESDKDREDWEISAYENRWIRVNEATSELKAAIMESEAAWDEDFKAEMLELHKLIIKLSIATRHYLGSKSSSTNTSLLSEKDEEVLWGIEDDTYDKQLSVVVKQFELKVKSRFPK